VNVGSEVGEAQERFECMEQRKHFHIGLDAEFGELNSLGFGFMIVKRSKENRRVPRKNDDNNNNTGSE
jgi:CRISPR/Cas system endoribonuclease Cas6 (RAMP superfamily)